MTVIGYLRTAWSALFEPPWRHARKGDVFDIAAQRGFLVYPTASKWGVNNPELVAGVLRWLVWLVGWLWIAVGLLLGAFIAPTLAQHIEPASSTYRDYIAIGIAVVVAFVVQLTGWLLMLLSDWSARGINGPLRFRWFLIFTPIGFLLMLWPIPAVGFILYRYLTWIGPGQQAATITFLGAVFVKQLILPIAVGVVRGRAFKMARDWLRGGTEQNTR